jgi:HEPN domain-containing protein
MFPLTKKNDYLSRILTEEFKYINSTMEVIYNHADDIYEAMADHDCEQLLQTAQSLMDILKDLKESYTED